MRSVGYDGTDESLEAFCEKIDPLEGQIIEIPAKTLEGFRAKARAVALRDDFEETFSADIPHLLAGSLIRDLLLIA